MFGVTSPMLVYWGLRSTACFLGARLVFLQYREAKGKILKWWNLVITLLTILSALFIGLVSIRNHLRRIITFISFPLVNYFESFFEGITPRETVVWGFMMLVGLAWVFKWLAPSLAPTPGNENKINTPNTTVIVQPSPAINLAGLDSVGVAIGNIIKPFMLSHNNQSTIQQSDLTDTLANLQAVLQTILVHIKDMTITMDSMPKVNTLASSLLEMADLVQVEGAATRQTVKDIIEVQNGDNIQTGETNERDSDICDESDTEPNCPLVANAKVERSGKINKNMGRKKRPTTVAREQGVAAPPETLLEELRPKPQVVLTREDLDGFIGKTQQEIVTELHNREKQRRDKDKMPEYLTDVEKKLARTSLASLDRQWRLKAGWKLKPTDYIEIGQLVEEQLELPRNLVLRIIRNRRADDFTERMKVEGREVVRCDKCRRLYPVDSVHNCFVAAGWSKPAKRDGVPATREMVITQTGRGGIQIRQQVGVDADKLNDNYKRMAEYKLVLNDSGENNNNNNNQQSNKENRPSSNDDAEMADATTAQDPAVVLLTETNNPTTAVVQDKTTGQFFRLVPC
jgi:hypothetical protein